MKRLLGRVLVWASPLPLMIVPVTLTASAAGSVGAVQLEAVIEGRRVSGSNPVVLDPSKFAVLQIRVANNADHPIVVSTVRLEGNVIGLAFFAYDTSIGMRLEPGEVEDRVFELNLAGLSGQAVGLIPSSLEILDADGAILAAETMIVDVRGSLRSVYGIIGFAIVALTLAAFAQALVKLARHTLPPDRSKRGLKLTAPGVGAGLSAVFMLSIIHISAPTAERWIPLVAAGGLLGFFLGYLTPSPEAAEEEWDEEEWDEDEFEGRLVPASGATTRVTFPEEAGES